MVSRADDEATVLMNIGTIKTSRQKGAATALIKGAIEAADREKVSIYLDTVSEGLARELFDKLGFKEVGRFEIDLSKYGGQGCHSHVGMIRWAW
jgi:ribosomal protein S18 acetylase RimI-like enzyme